MRQSVTPEDVHREETSDLFIKRKTPLFIAISMALGLIALVFTLWFWGIYAPAQRNTPCDEDYSEMYLIEYQMATDETPVARVELTNGKNRQWHNAPPSFLTEAELLNIENRFGTLCVQPHPRTSGSVLLKRTNL